MTVTILLLSCFAQADDEARKHLGALQRRLLDSAPLSLEIRVDTRFQPPGDSFGIRTAVATTHKEYLVASGNSYYFESQIAPGHLQREHFRSGLLTIDSPTARIYSRESYPNPQSWPHYCGQDCLRFVKASLLAPVFFPPIEASIRSLQSRNPDEVGVAYETRNHRSEPMFVELWIQSETGRLLRLTTKVGRKTMSYQFRYKDINDATLRQLEPFTVSEKAKRITGSRSLIRSQEQKALNRPPTPETANTDSTPAESPPASPPPPEPPADNEY